MSLFTEFVSVASSRGFELFPQPDQPLAKGLWQFGPWRLPVQFWTAAHRCGIRCNIAEWDRPVQNEPPGAVVSTCPYAAWGKPPPILRALLVARWSRLDNQPEPKLLFRAFLEDSTTIVTSPLTAKYIEEEHARWLGVSASLFIDL